MTVSHSAITESYTLSLHDALPIYCFVGPTVRLVERTPGNWVLAQFSDRLGELRVVAGVFGGDFRANPLVEPGGLRVDRKSTRLNSSHVRISYAVFCLKKKKTRILF